MFSFEHTTISSNSVKEEGVLIIPQNPSQEFLDKCNYRKQVEEIKDLHPLFVPKDRSVPFFLKFTGYSLHDYFDYDQLGDIFDNSPNLINLWQELIDADVAGADFYTWSILDVNSNILLYISQAEGRHDNMLEVSTTDSYNEFDDVIQVAYEQDIVLSKRMYEKYMELNSLSKQDLFEMLKNLGDDGLYFLKLPIASQIEKLDVLR